MIVLFVSVVHTDDDKYMVYEIEEFDQAEPNIPTKKKEYRFRNKRRRKKIYKLTNIPSLLKLCRL